MLALVLDELHGVVDCLAQRVDVVTVLALEVGIQDVIGQVDQIVELGLAGQVECALGGKVTRLDRHHAPAAHGTSLQYLGLDHLIAAIGIAQEQQCQHRHAILAAGQLTTLTQQVGRFPQFRFKFPDIYHSFCCFS